MNVYEDNVLIKSSLISVTRDLSNDFLNIYIYIPPGKSPYTHTHIFILRYNGTSQ